MAKVWTTTVPNPFDNQNQKPKTYNDFTNISRSDHPNGDVVGNNLLLKATGSSNEGRGVIETREGEKLDLEKSNLEYNEFWNKLKSNQKGGYANTGGGGGGGGVSGPLGPVGSIRRHNTIKSIPDLTFSWEGVNAFCQKKRSIWKSCWHGLTKRTTNANGSENGSKRDREMIIGGGKWDQTRANNDAYFHLNENKVTAISYRASSSSSASNSSSTTEDSSTIESFSSSTSSIGSKPNFFQVLNNVNGYLKAGECLAIMGASGSGKTTLLNVLNFRHFKNFKVTASIKLNGKKINERELIARSAYILQDDLFIPTLTVQEHLIFLAMIKMDPKLSKQEKIMRVEEILDEFNLIKCKNTKIGGVNDTKGISGGEKRRLAFASEILTDPLILFCDEPTSGLDSHMALMIVNTLYKLAKKGKIIISTIHQPSSQVFDKFQKLCLLAEGRVAYFGDREQAFDFFKSMSYECPLKYNPADYYIEVLASKVNKKSNLEKIKDICDSFERSPYHQNTLRELKDIDERYKKFDKELIIGNAYGNLGLRFRASYLTQFIWLFWRQLLSMLREPLATRILMAQSIIIGIFLGFTYFRLDFDQKGIQNRNGLLFMVLLQICIIYLYGVASNFHEHWVITKRDVKNGVYSIVIYYIAKTLSELPKNVIFPLLTVTIVYWLSNIHPSFQIYVTVTTILVFAGNTSVGFGSFLAVIAPNLDATLGIIGPTFFPLLIFSGFLINSSSIPAYFMWIKYISWMFYANEAMMIALWRNVGTIKCPQITSTNSFDTSSVACVTTGKEVLQMLSMEEGNFTFDMAILASMNVFWFTIAGLTIYIKSKF